MPSLRISRSAAAIGIVVVLTFVVGLTLAGEQRSDSKPTLKGVWRAAEIRYTGPNARTVTPQPWFGIMTDNHYAWVGVQSDKARPELPPPDKRTDEQVAEAFTPFVGQLGTYEAVRDELRNDLIVAKNPNFMHVGAFATYTYRFEGPNILWLTQDHPEAKKAESKPAACPTTWKFVRVE